MNVALVHDYLNQAGGAERALAALHRLFPEAPIFTTIADQRVIEGLLRGADVHTTWMQRLPAVRRRHRGYFLLYPRAIESIDLRGYDLVISNSSAFAKSVRTPPGTVHVCYCHTPMRFAWMFDRYAAQEAWNAPTAWVVRRLVRRLQRWDLATASRPTRYLANSSTGARRIRDWYGRPADIVHPPVEVERFTPRRGRGEFHLVVSRLIGYKRVDLVIDAFNRLRLPLVIIGDGTARRQLERRAGPTIRFLGRAGDAVVADHYARCRALVFPGEEDFGITPLEANAAGRPVIAYAAGGALDTVVDGRTGVFFREQTVEALCAAVTSAAERRWDPAALRAHAETFRESAFHARMTAAIDAALRGEPLPPAPTGRQLPATAAA